MLLRPQDHEKIAAAIAAAETKTSGEIVAVVARECSEYWEVPLAWGVGAALIAPAAALLAGLHPALIGQAGSGWVAAHSASVATAVGQALAAYAIVQAVLFVVVALVVSIPPVRRLLTPKALKHERVRRRAEEQFAAQGIHLTEGRTGLLIFAALAERRAEVIVDAGLAKAMPASAFDGVLAALIAGMKANDPGSGFAEAIARAGELLGQHAPRRPDDRNELPDTVIELEH
jgi:putative membrane protein